MKKKKELTFKDVYQLPLSEDDFCSYIYSSNGVMTFDIIIDNRVIITELLEIINGESNKRVKRDVTYEDGYVKIGGYHIFLLRGWGHLTGCGALNLPAEKAAKIQDDFANWVVNKLKGIEE